MKENPKVSIIIPFHKDTKYARECIQKCLELNYPNYEIIVVKDEGGEIVCHDPKVKIISTKQILTGPAEKRDIAFSLDLGDIVAFIDDDAYPKKDWLMRAVEHFQHEDIEALGGPALTPPNDSFLQKAGGAVIGSVAGSGPLAFRYSQRKRRFVDDFPSYNLLVVKNLFIKVGGFGSKFYGGEDSYFCLKIKNAGRKILYVPDVVVYHHRRPLFIRHLKQIANFGRHRGYFAKKYPRTSRRLIYFLPLCLFLATMAVLIFSCFIIKFTYWFFALALLGYLLLFFVNFYVYRNFLISLVFPLGIVSTHLVYGFNFLRGLFIRHMEK